jgi:hypothetical protein
MVDGGCHPQAKEKEKKTQKQNDPFSKPFYPCSFF